MGTKFAVGGSNLDFVYQEIKMSVLLPQLHPQDFVNFFIRNYYRFLDGVFHKWLANFDIEPFHSMINNFSPDLKFIFEDLSKSIFKFS